MADHKTANAPIPPHTVRHVDGVMHLTLQVNPDTPTVAESLRFHPPADLSEEG
jgi:hypothetical protein